jgi:hypothetical protein
VSQKLEVNQNITPNVTMQVRAFPAFPSPEKLVR